MNDMLNMKKRYLQNRFHKLSKPYHFPRSRALLPVLMLTSVTLVACTTDDPYARTKVGSGIGAVSGAVIGNQVGGGRARAIGAAIGAIAGGAVGNYQDKQQKALEDALRDERQQKQIAIERLQNDVLRVSLSDEASFGFDSAELKPAFLSTLDKLAREMSSFDKTVLHIVGYTDDIGSETYNLGLSTQRANAVARYLEGNGVASQRLVTEGRGEAEPRVPNTTAANRSRNRRVEIYIQPVVEGQEQNALRPPAPT